MGQHAQIGTYVHCSSRCRGASLCASVRSFDVEPYVIRGGREGYERLKVHARAHLPGHGRRGSCRSGADNSAVLAQTSEPGLLEGLAGLDWGVDRRDLAERVGHCLFHIPAPPDDQLALPLVLGDRGRDHVER